MPPLALGPLHLTEVAHPYHATADRGDDRVAHLLKVCIGTGALEGEAARSDIDDARRDVGVLALKGLGDERRADAELRDPAQVHLDAQLALREGPGLGRTHPRHRLERVLQFPGLILQVAVVRLFGDEGVLHDVDEAGTEATDMQLPQLRWKRGAQRVDLADHLFVLFVGVGAGEELDDGEGHPVRDHALHLPQIVELRETIL